MSTVAFAWTKCHIRLWSKLAIYCPSSDTSPPPPTEAGNLVEGLISFFSLSFCFSYFFCVSSDLARFPGPCPVQEIIP